MAESPEWEGGCFWVTSPGPVPSAKGLWQNLSKGHGEGWILSPRLPTTGPAGSREVQLWPADLESWLRAAPRGHRTGQPLGPRQQCLEAWVAGKGKVTSLPPGICCLEASPWRPEGSGWVKIANPRGCKFQESESEKRGIHTCSCRSRGQSPSWRRLRGSRGVSRPYPHTT